MCRARICNSAECTAASIHGVIPPSSGIDAYKPRYQVFGAANEPASDITRLVDAEASVLS